MGAGPRGSAPGPSADPRMVERVELVDPNGISSLGEAPGVAKTDQAGFN